MVEVIDFKLQTVIVNRFIVFWLDFDIDSLAVESLWIFFLLHAEAGSFLKEAVL